MFALSAGSRAALLKEAARAGDWIDVLIDHQRVLTLQGTFDRVERFTQLKNQAAHLTNMLAGSPDGQEADRALEQVMRSTQQVEDIPLQILTKITPREPKGVLFGHKGEAEVNDMNRRVEWTLGTYDVDSVLDRFRRKAGIASLGNFIENPAERDLLYDPESAFHAPAVHSRLTAMAEAADEVVSENFFVYLSGLVGHFRDLKPAEEKTAAILRVAWLGASKVRPQPSMEKEFVGMVLRLGKLLPDDHLVVPAWVTPSDEAMSDAAEAAD